MLSKKNLYFLVFVFILGAFFIGQIVYSADLDNIQFPIVELGNCQSKQACEVYCNQEANMLACLEYGEKQGIISAEEAGKGKKILELGTTSGPGGCQGEAECKSYCDNQDNLSECIDFAIKHDLMSEAELKEAQQVLQALQKGAKLPGGCKSKTSCEAYCEDIAHLEECLAFGEATGMISSEEAAIARKTGGQGPGGCKGKEECESYCAGPDHMLECIEFGLEYDLMPAEEKEQAIKIMAALKKGVKMPNCKGKEDCDKYCSQPENMEECMAFAEAAGMISPEEAEEAKQMMELGLTSGPGGCQGKEECEKFCNNPGNMSECIDFAVKIGEMTEEEAKEAKRMAELGLTSGPGGCRDKKDCEKFCNNPDNFKECLDFNVKIGVMSTEEAKANLEMAEKGIVGGPGGCQSQEMCEAFCNDPANADICLQSAVQMGKMTEQEMMEIKKMREPEFMPGPDFGGAEGGPMPGPEMMPEQGPVPMHDFPKDVGHPKEMPEGYMPPDKMQEFMPPTQPPTAEEIEKMIKEQIPEQIPEPPLPEEIEKMMPEYIPGQTPSYELPFSKEEEQMMGEQMPEQILEQPPEQVPQPPSAEEIEQIIKEQIEQVEQEVEE